MNTFQDTPWSDCCLTALEAEAELIFLSLILFYYRALDHPILGPKFGPIPNAKKYVFPKFKTKNSHFDKTNLFFGGFSIFISYNINTEHIVTYLQFHRIIEYNNTCFLKH